MRARVASPATVAEVGILIQRDVLEVPRGPCREYLPSVDLNAQAVMAMSRANSASALPRWRAISDDGRSCTTVAPPITAWPITKATAAVVPNRSQRFPRWEIQASTAKLNIRSPTLTEARRCEYSIRISGSRGGMTCPWQRGQSGQARPESVALTTPPRTIRA